MIVSTHRIYCDSVDCSSAFPERGPVILSMFDLRAKAEGAGWKRFRGEDMCPYCFRALMAKQQAERQSA